MRGIMRLALLGVPGAQGASGPIEYVNDSPTAIVPTLGEELTTNGDLLAWTDDNPDWWLVANESGGDPEITERDSGQLHADIKTVGGAMNIYASSNANHVRIQKKILSVGQWYQLQAVVSAQGAGPLYLQDDSGVLNKPFYAVGTHTIRGRVGGTGYAQFKGGSFGPSNITVDAVSVKQVTGIMASERASVPVGSWGYTHWHIVDMRQAGFYFKYDADDYLYAYACRVMGRIYLDKCVGGVITRVANATFTYSDTKAIWWRHAELNTWLIGYDTPANIEAYDEADFTTNALINVNTVTDTNLNLLGNVYEFGALSSDAENAPQKYYFCGLEGLDGSNVAKPDPGDFTASRATSPLATPTSDGSGQAVHPSVVKFDTAWNGYTYWMALTPFPASNPEFENPEILGSNDGSTWEVPPGLTNPIAPKPEGSDWNADPELIYNSADGKLYCYWITTDGTTHLDINVSSSSDGVTWSAAAKLLTGGVSSMLSPSVIYDGTQWVMYYRNGGGWVDRRTCATPDGMWSAATACTGRLLPAAFVLWHLHVTFDGQFYYMLGAESNDDIYLLISDDGLTWYCGQLPLLTNGSGAGNWDNANLYRACSVKSGQDLDIWYSAKSDAGAWHIGRTQATLQS